MEPEEPNQVTSTYLRPAAASAATGLGVRQLSRLADEGRIRSTRPGNHRRYHRDDIAALAAGDTTDPVTSSPGDGPAVESSPSGSPATSPSAAAESPSSAAVSPSDTAA